MSEALPPDYYTDGFRLYLLRKLECDVRGAALRAHCTDCYLETDVVLDATKWAKCMTLAAWRRLRQQHHAKEQRRAAA